jgi:hypothetical protein
MSRTHQVFLCAVVMVMMITAGCTFPNSSGAQPLITGTPTFVATPVPTAPAAAGTTPGTAGTQAPGTCAADTSSDAANCGGCGYACPANALCQAGQCYCKEGYAVKNNQCDIVPNEDTITGNGCPTGMSPCPDGYCYELSSSAANCGICGNMCPTGMFCSASTCTNVPADVTTGPTAAVTTTVSVTTTSSGSSGSGLSLGSGSFTATKACMIMGGTTCSGACVNLSTSTTNCGACGKVCKSLAPNCCNGNCVDYLTNSSSCGSCGHKCTLGTTCVAGSCKTKVGVGPTMVKVPTYVLVQPIYQNPVGPVGPVNPGY